MAHPLELAYDWRRPVAVSTVGLVVCVGILVQSQTLGWLSAAIVLVLGYAGFLIVVWMRTRAYLMADGPVLTVRTFRTLHRIEGSDVVRVRQILTSRGPSYKITVGEADGRLVHRGAPTALLRRGHSTLFGWILTWAPQAELDKGARSTLQTLRERGALPYPDDQGPPPAPTSEARSDIHPEQSEQTSRE